MTVNTKPFGRSGVPVTEIGMGTYYDMRWVRLSKHGWVGGASKKVRALVAGLEGGMNLIDSAEAYYSEQLVAKAIKGRKRDELFIATKVWHDNFHRDDLVASLDKSLRKLETSYVDLYQLHFPSHHIPVQETMAAMEQMKEKGRIRFIGVSNHSVEQMVAANEALRRSEIASNQMRYSLAHREIEKDVLPYCQRNNIVLLAYYPLGHGELASANEKMADVCKRNSKTPAQVALNWLVSKPGVFAIPRASTEEHVRENLGASGWRLNAQDVADLEAAFPA
ncbi:MAG TPA: aldo/keto reductase [Nitrososphaerales archaeon]|nr:aldo/keto reductase [Nitrososphaerales archaeon]